MANMVVHLECNHKSCCRYQCAKISHVNANYMPSYIVVNIHGGEVTFTF